MSMAIRPQPLNSPPGQSDALLSALGFHQKSIHKHLRGLNRHKHMLRHLLKRFHGQAGGMSPQNAAGMLQKGTIPGQGAVQPPSSRCCSCQGHYAPSNAPKVQTMDLGAFGGAPPGSPQASKNRRMAAKIERFIQSNPAAKQQLEAMFGGKIMNDGRADGVLKIQKFGAGAVPGAAPGLQQPGAAPGAAPHALNALAGIDRGAALAGGLPSQSPNNFNRMILGGLANALGGRNAMPGAQAMMPAQGGAMPGNRRVFSVGDMLKGPQMPGMPGMPGAAQGAPGGGIGGMPGAIPAIPGGAPGGAPIGMPGMPGMPGASTGMPGMPGTAGGAPGMGGAGGIGNILNAPGMTVEDMVVMLLMKVTKGFDKQIQAQAQKVNNLQQQQGAGGKGGAQGGQGAGGKGAGGQGAPSMDVESMKLKRMIDKRSQMFDMLRQVIDKYNSTAKNMIDALGR